jgi:hypothetical protein
MLDVSLERAAEVVGDITAPTMARFYAAYPEARAAFEHHALGKRQALEAEMVDRALYWAMNWLERPGEISIQLGSSVPHHQETLKIALPWYRGLLEAVIDVIISAIPEDRPAELALWRQIRGELGQMVEDSKSTYTPRRIAAA